MILGEPAGRLYCHFRLRPYIDLKGIGGKELRQKGVVLLYVKA